MLIAEGVPIAANTPVDGTVDLPEMELRSEGDAIIWHITDDINEEPLRSSILGDGERPVERQYAFLKSERLEDLMEGEHVMAWENASQVGKRI